MIPRDKYLVWGLCIVTIIFLWIQLNQLSVLRADLHSKPTKRPPLARVVVETDHGNPNMNNLRNVFGDHNKPPHLKSVLEPDLQVSLSDLIAMPPSNEPEEEEEEEEEEQKPDELPGARIFHGVIPMGKLGAPVECPVNQVDYQSTINFPVSGVISHHGPKDILSSFFSTGHIIEPTRLDLIERLMVILQGEAVSVLDVGAFVGLFSVVFASHYEVEKVYAFEPLSINLQRACETVHLNYFTEKINLYKVALGESYNREKWCAPYDNLGYVITEGCPTSSDLYFEYYNHESVQVVETEAWMMTSLSGLFSKPRGEHVIVVKISVANGYEERILSAKALFAHSNVRHLFITGYWNEWKKYDPEKWVKEMKKMGWSFFTETCDPLDSMPPGEMLEENPKLFLTKDPKKVCAKQNTMLIRPV